MPTKFSAFKYIYSLSLTSLLMATINIGNIWLIKDNVRNYVPS